MANCQLYHPLQWRHNERDDVSNHQRFDCLLNRLFRRRSKKTSKLRVTGLCEGNSPVTGEFPAPRASNAENVSIWWRHHDICHNCTVVVVDIDENTHTKWKTKKIQDERRIFISIMTHTSTSGFNCKSVFRPIWVCNWYSSMFIKMFLPH